MQPWETGPQQERVRRFLLERLARGLKQPSGGRLGPLSRQFFASPEGIYAFEYAGCDPARENCAGELRGAWLIDREGSRAIEATPDSVPGGRRGMWYRFHRFHFHVAPAGDWLVLASLAGPRAGSGGRYGIIPTGEGFVLAAEGSHWRA